MKHAIFKSAYKMPAYNFIFFNLYYTLHQNAIVANCNNELDVINTINEITYAENPIEKIRQLCVNIGIGYENMYKDYIPYHFKAFDCLLSGVELDLENEEESFSIKNFIDSFSIKESIRSFNISISEQLDSIYYDDKFYRTDVIRKKNQLLSMIQNLESLPICENMFDLYEIQLEQQTKENLKNFNPLRILGFNEEKDYKDKYLKDIQEFVYRLGYKSINDLKKISIIDYYTAVNAKMSE